jgi:hypothetical protein
VTAVLAAPVLAADQILGVERGGFIMIVVSLLVLLLGVPIAARLGKSETAVFRRTGVVYGALMLAVLFGAFLIVKQVY